LLFYEQTPFFVDKLGEMMSRHIHLGDLRRKMIVLEKDLTIALNLVKETIKTLTFEENVESEE
tara:strand:+ start:1574 stop:1762 length:189 start_codon:yes stop_codon:yes gene_type:complete